MIRKFAKLYLFFIFFSTYILYSQGSAGAKAIFESRYIVDMPTAGVIPKGTFSALGIIFRDGGIMTDFSASPFENFNMGISFSGIKLIGDGTPIFQNIPSISIRFRIVNESLYFPALLIGINTQGRGKWYDDLKRFETLSPGVFISASKSYRWVLGYFAFHGAFCYSFEGNKTPNFWIGLEHSIGSFCSMNIEYNANLDEQIGLIMNNKGLLNTSFRFSVIKGLTFEIQVRDILENSKESKGFQRVLSIEFINQF